LTTEGRYQEMIYRLYWQGVRQCPFTNGRFWFRARLERFWNHKHSTLFWG